jgi:hypothetical protein
MVSGTEREFTLKGLKERHHYEFWVVARTAVGKVLYKTKIFLELLNTFWFLFFSIF